MDMQKAYESAAELYRACSKKCVLNERPQINFIKDSLDFWYVRDVLDQQKKVQKEYVRYRAQQNQAVELFCTEQLKKAIEPFLPETAEPEKQEALPLENIVVEGEKLYFSLKGRAGEFVYDSAQNELIRLEFALHNPQEVSSPDQTYSVFVREHNLYSRDNRTGKVKQLSKDGCQDIDWATRFMPVSDNFLSEEPMKQKPAVVWSPDSRYFITYRTDRRLLGQLGLVQSNPKWGPVRPNHPEYRYALPGDDHILEAQVFIGDAQAGKLTRVTLDEQPLILYLLAMFNADGDQVKWTKDTDEAYLVRYDRFFKTIQCVLIDAKTAMAKVIWQESYQTFGFVEYYGSASQEHYSEMSMRYLPKTQELLWHSETDGWSTLWLIDLRTGEKKRRYTADTEVFRRLKYVDEENRILYFTAAGVDKNIDPYYQELFACSMDSGERRQLSQEKQEHFVSFQPQGGYYVDTHSTVQTLPVTQVLDLEGKLLLELEQADISLIEHLYIQPEPFEALARDGKTKIYGILIKPADFDPSKKYPVVDYIYGGAQRINTPKAFEFNLYEGALPYGGLEYLAHLGFVGVIVDGLATPLRSKAIHDVIYEKAEECCGLTDHVEAIRQLGERFSWIDTEHVGIWGASGGGYATARALLQFGDFYKVGVSMCGNHDQAIYHAHWGERWMGPYSEEKYYNQANHHFAKNLKGKLFLIHGDMDDNVHPAATIKLIAALIEENKDFDSLIFPNSAHAVARFPYVIRKKWDYFVRHLLGQQPPEGFDLTPPKE